ncbi:MAG: restriction endonuclease subunit S, partial [Candidatus Paceibacterota bacterium]
VSANTNINQDSLKLLKIALPPTLAEQQAIASALSDVDELICSLDTLIQKKEAIKKGTMQQLLSGNKRLPGFDIEWEVKALGDLFEITSSKRVFKSEWEKEGIPFYRARELAVLSEKGSVDNDLFIDRKLFEKHKSSYGVPQIGDLLVTGVGTLGKVYLVSNNNEFYFKDGNIIWFRINEKVNPEFLMHLYSSPIVIKQINESSAGSTVGTYTITAANKTKIPFPSLEEQKAIAQILSDMDREIQSLHRKREKVGQIKQGMMQELLTGRVRLV